MIHRRDMDVSPQANARQQSPNPSSLDAGFASERKTTPDLPGPSLRQTPRPPASREASASTGPGSREASASTSDKKITKAQIKKLKELAKNAPSLIVLCGLPGSGKSTFRKALVMQNHCEWTTTTWEVVSQDDLGSRRKCEALIGILAKDKKKKVILDRCNPDPKDREYWVRLAFSPKDATAVHMNTPLEVCLERLKKRSEHKTLNAKTKQSKMQMIVRGFKKRFVAPSKKEGFNKVYTINTAEQAADLLMSWGCLPSDVPWMHITST
ncbi:hypothetical protein AAMO2058_001238000 [Amorphochlora amoebiformis]